MKDKHKIELLFHEDENYVKLYNGKVYKIDSYGEFYYSRSIPKEGSYLIYAPTISDVDACNIMWFYTKRIPKNTLVSLIEK